MEASRIFAQVVPLVEQPDAQGIIQLPSGERRTCIIEEPLCSHHYFYSFFHKLCYDNNVFLRPKTAPVPTDVKASAQYQTLKKEKAELKEKMFSEILHDFEYNFNQIVLWAMQTDRSSGFNSFCTIFKTIRKLGAHDFFDFESCFNMAKRDLIDLDSGVNLLCLNQARFCDLIEMDSFDLNQAEVLELNRLFPEPQLAESPPSLDIFFQSPVYQPGKVELLSTVDLRKIKMSLVKILSDYYFDIKLFELNFNIHEIRDFFKAFPAESILLEAVLRKANAALREEINRTQLNFTYPLVKLFESKLLVNEEFDNVVEITNLLIKEQKKHSFARFNDIYNHYASFVRRVKIVMSMAEELEPGQGDAVKGLVCRILSESHKDEFSRDPDHHASWVMGYEPEDIPFEDKTNSLNCIRFLTRTRQKELDQHAHTLPFPAMFCWHEEYLCNLLGIDKSTTIGIFENFSKDNFFKIKEQPLLGDHLFQNKLEEIRKQLQGKSADYFVYEALLALKWLHLRLHSETEYLPAFVNQKLDALSEWHLKGSQGNSALQESHYKRNIAEALIKSLESNDQPDAFTIWPLFEEYRDQTLEKIHDKMRRWEKRDSLFNLILRIGAIQVKQAILANPGQQSATGNFLEEPKFSISTALIV